MTVLEVAVTHRCGTCDERVQREATECRKRQVRADRRYCSNACRQRAYRERKKHELSPLELEALMWRHRRILRVLQRPPAAFAELAPIDALLAVVSPSSELLEASLAAVAEEHEQVAA